MSIGLSSITATTKPSPPDGDDIRDGPCNPVLQVRRILSTYSPLRYVVPFVLEIMLPIPHCKFRVGFPITVYGGEEVWIGST